MSHNPSKNKSVSKFAKELKKFYEDSKLQDRPVVGSVKEIYDEREYNSKNR